MKLHRTQHNQLHTYKILIVNKDNQGNTTINLKTFDYNSISKLVGETIHNIFIRAKANPFKTYIKRNLLTSSKFSQYS